MRPDAIRIAIVGVGNCASALVQGLAHYGAPQGNEPPVGIMNPDIGGYGPSDMIVAAAFDVIEGKVGRDVRDAILAPPNNTIRFADVPPTGVVVRRGPTLDGIGQYVAGTVSESPEAPVDVAAILRDARVDVVVSYLPVGSEAASRHYAETALAAGCGFVNCVPVFLASDPAWARRFAERGLPIVGDDIKSQVGATIVHRMLARLFADRGVRLDNTYQLNFGGNADFLNMLERDRLQSKKVSKTRAVTSQIAGSIAEDRVHVGPSDHVPWLQDRKFAHIRLEGTGFGGAPLSVDLKLEVWDSPNSAGIVVDAVRCAMVAKARGEGGPLAGPSAYLMKSPPRQFTDEEARVLMDAFVRGETPAG